MEWKDENPVLYYRILSPELKALSDKSEPKTNYALPLVAFLTHVHGDEDAIYPDVLQLTLSILENSKGFNSNTLGFIDSAHDDALLSLTRTAYGFVDLNREFPYFLRQRVLGYYYPLAAKYRQLFETGEFKAVKALVTFHEDTDNPDLINPKRKDKEKIKAGYYAYFTRPDGGPRSLELEKKVVELHNNFVNNILKKQVPPFDVFSGPDDPQLGNNNPDNGMLISIVDKKGKGIDSTLESYMVYRGLVAPEKCKVSTALTIEIPRYELVYGRYQPITRERRALLMKLVEEHFLRPYLALVQDC